MIKTRFAAHMAMLCAALCYGANFHVAKWLMPLPLNPEGFIALRIICAGAIFWVLHAIWVKESVERRDFLRLAICGICGCMVNMLLFFKGLSETSAVSSALITTSTPLLVLVISYSTGIERLSWLRVLGITLGLAGTTMLIMSYGLDFRSSEVWGNIMVLGNAFFYSVYLIVVRPLLKKYHPFTVLKWIFLFGAVGTFAVSWEDTLALSLGTLTLMQWGAFAFVVVGATVLSYVLNIAALGVVRSSMVGYYVYIQPLFAMLIGVVMGMEATSFTKIASGGLMFLGIYIIEVSRIRQEKGLPA